MATPANNTPSVSNQATPATAQTSSGLTQQLNDLLPGPTVLLQAAKLSMDLDRPIQLDYYRQTAQGSAFIGEDISEPAPGKEKERVLVKSKEEFTSFIKKMYKIDNKVGDKVVGFDCIVLTENSLYVISGKTQKKRINLASLHADDD